MFISPNSEERIQTLKRLLDRFGPTAPDFSALLTKAEERELGVDEIDALYAEGAIDVAALQARATAALKTNQASLENLVPKSLVYFEHFCGPKIAGADHEEHFRRVLPQYRKDLIRRDLVRGLDICLQGALWDGLIAGTWTDHVNDDQLWDALTACDPWRNPSALLGGLDIALGRQPDERYRTFAREGVEKLIQEEFPRPDGNDTYELLQLWAQLVLNRINSLEGGAVQPRCWQRMCVWMQAGLLGRLTQSINFELESLHEWIEANQTLTGEYAKMVDLRHEPMLHAAEMSRRAHREEVIGSLLMARNRHLTAGRMVQVQTILVKL
jgi:hypothetical protein